MKKKVYTAFYLFFVGLLCVWSRPTFCQAELPLDFAEIEEPARASLKISPLNLRGGSRLMLVSPEQWYPLAKKLSRYLKKSHEQFTRLYGEIPAFETTVKLLNSEDFYRQTGAPSWTNAMYYRGEITIPIDPEEFVEVDETL